MGRGGRVGEGAREEARVDATIALAREEVVMEGCRRGGAVAGLGVAIGMVEEVVGLRWRTGGGGFGRVSEVLVVERMKAGLGGIFGVESETVLLLERVLLRER